MTITYSCVANGRAVLAELALTGGSYQEAAATVLRLVLLRAEQKTIIQMGSFVYHTLFIDGITYLCATDNALDTITPSAFLTNVSDTFLRNPLMSQEHFSPSNAVAADFQQVLGKYMMKYNKNQDGSSISTLKSQVTDVKNIMSQNIDEILESEKRLNIYTDRTSYLQTTAKESQKPRKILRRIWWKHFKKIIIITVGRVSLVCFSPRSFSSKEADPMTKPKCRGWKLDYSGFVICSFLRYT
ncbi:uncharacterized protein [Canis lupus baileyi]|uniref:uncharacterized protein LOC112646486 isoform X1 n=1 Tax=Canis lupus dingo TaxID=286419 RepID=UPI000DC68E82|nr:uncharacterized protein LOC112646486 isoform X1 [Canis lupus dingo]XP_025282302.3 uncharacterized protein LOC112646486 isoform X1 [Canis lupus dingo]XP_048960957.1 uncharacterized protein LOC112646486 isoform X1 [Canis lupus dingo]XP_048960958.1 uncharacterized protein LOC112646486 isoform X1 [Canis lupus dingo]XP_048960959.1 uncharacterized protein LOC112646486 isoform X1 [Canis lupus dingo]